LVMVMDIVSSTKYVTGTLISTPVASAGSDVIVLITAVLEIARGIERIMFFRDFFILSLLLFTNKIWERLLINSFNKRFNNNHKS
jgi:hypothetical protein